ncbi:MAG: right-handed parallel beta-helix repeat-containing protein [Verrucomicrobiota bacterium]
MITLTECQLWSRLCLGLWVGAAAMGAAAEPSGTSAACGAAVPFITIEAEDPANRTSGLVVKLSKLPSGLDNSPELEASGRAYVELRQTGDFLEIPKTPAGNGLVIRHCIPDAPQGGGITATLGLYVNGKRRQTLRLSSKHNWLYGTGKLGENGQSNQPTKFPHVFWDEARWIVEGGLKAGDSLRLQKDATDNAEFYRIDLLELEPIPPPLPQPANSLSIATYGAKGQDATADTAAIRKCIEEAQAQGKTVWLPAGTFLQNAAFTVRGVRVQGAGMWHTSLCNVPGTAPKNWSGCGGFVLAGSNPSVSDLYMDGLETTSRGAEGAKAFTGGGTNWSVRNVWIAHAHVGFWVGGIGGTVSGCRVRFSYADGININNGGGHGPAHNILVENNHVRGTGDDGLAILGEAPRKGPHQTLNVTLRHNTVAAVWWGGNCDLAGGNGHLIEDNVFADGGSAYNLGLNLPAAFPMCSLTGAIVRRNLIIRGGNNYASQRRGAIWIYPGTASIASTVIEDNRIIAPLFRGIHLAGSSSQQIVFKGNLIEHPGEDAIVIDGKVTGRGTFTANTVRNLNPGRKPLANSAGESYKLVQTGNSWK